MERKRTIPFRDADFNVVQAIISKTASKNRSLWKLDNKWLDSVLLPKKAEWDAAYAAYENHTTRNRNITFAKTEKRKAYRNRCGFWCGIFNAMCL